MADVINSYIGLFIPCYIDQFYPNVGIATLELLQRLGLDVHYPLKQTCCGQPLANSGAEKKAISVYLNFIKNFSEFDYIVDQTVEVKDVRENTYELCEFLIDILQVDDVGAVFPKKVGLHQSCHGLRGLELGKPSELVTQWNSKVHQLLAKVKGIELVSLDREDECCGFGGTFSVFESDVSVKMGRMRVKDHETHGAEVITATDMSCLMHLEGIIRREKKPVRVMHIAEILNSRL